MQEQQTPELDRKLDALRKGLAELESVIVAFSGGVDSTFLLRVATEVDGLTTVALTTDSPTNTEEEICEARALAASFGAEHVVHEVNELKTPGYAANPANRCYLCKQTLYPLCIQEARKRSIRYVVDGVNTDDLGDYRPGLDAARELGVKHPLVDAGLTKADIRELSRRYGLPTADKPASPCLSSRFPYGTHIDKKRLTEVADAERAMHELGFVELRVRHLGDAARVEVAAAELASLDAPGMRSAIRRRLQAAGFAEVRISDDPLRSGSLNDALEIEPTEPST